MLNTISIFRNRWFWSGLAVIAATYVVVSRMASQVDKTKAEKYLKMQQEKQQRSTSDDSKVE